MNRNTYYFILKLFLVNLIYFSYNKNTTESTLLTDYEFNKNNFNTDNESNKKQDSVYVQFELLAKNLHDLIQSLAEIKKINIFIPSSLEAEKIMINFATINQIPLQEVEEYLIYFLSMAGYILTLQDNLYVVTKKIDDSIRRYCLPLYVNVSAEDLPDNVGYIRYIRFLEHVRVPVPSGQGSNAIKEILFNILPDKQNAIIVDPRTNAIIMTGPANAIAAAMLIINEIDNFGSEDYVYYLSLQNTNTAYVAKLLDDLLNISKESNPQNQANLSAYQGPSYFSPQIKIVQDVRNNALLLLGKKDAIDKIVDFVKKEIDIKQEQGNILIHVYELKYLDSKKIAPVIQDLVNGTSSSSNDQSIKDNNTNSSYRKFDNVRIIPEEVVIAKRSGTSEGTIPTRLTLGGNKLIISATKDDYTEIVKILERLDQPQSQVLIEVMILDVQYDLMNNFSSQSRLPSMFNLPEGAQLQSIMWDNSRVIMNNGASELAVTSSAAISPITSMNSDLLSGINPGESADGGKMTSLINNTPRNGFIISLGEQYKYSSIWSILQLEESIMQRNVIDNPTLVTQNNITAKIQNVSVKRGAGELSPNNTQYGGATVVSIQSYTASLGVNITPRISFGSCQVGKPIRLNLEISMAIEDFKNSSQNDFTKYNRSLKTNANVNSGDLLVLGGLHKQGVSDVVSKVPILGDIPLIGGLFRQTIKEQHDSNLIVIIKATIIAEDELREFTNNKKGYIENELSELALAHFKDDVTYLDIAINNKVSEDVLIKG